MELPESLCTSDLDQLNYNAIVRIAFKRVKTPKIISSHSG
jgi:hypothetical protein